MTDLVEVVSRSVFHDSETRADVFVGDVLEVTKLHADDLISLGLVENAASGQPIIEPPAAAPSRRRAGAA